MCAGISSAYLISKHQMTLCGPCGTACSLFTPVACGIWECPQTFANLTAGRTQIKENLKRFPYHRDFGGTFRNLAFPNLWPHGDWNDFSGLTKRSTLGVNTIPAFNIIHYVFVYKCLPSNFRKRTSWLGLFYFLGVAVSVF